MSHTIVREGEKYRCTTCRAVSMTRSVIEEIPCSTDKETAFRKVAKRTDPTDGFAPTWGNDPWPYLPRYGDTWWHPDLDRLLVLVQTAGHPDTDNHAWVDLGTGTPVDDRPRSLPLPGGGFHPHAQQVVQHQAYHRGANIETKDQIRDQLIKRTVQHCLSNNLLQVSPILVEENHSTAMPGLTAQCMVIKRPPENYTFPGRPDPEDSTSSLLTSLVMAYYTSEPGSVRY